MIQNYIKNISDYILFFNIEATHNQRKNIIAIQKKNKKVRWRGMLSSQWKNIFCDKNHDEEDNFTKIGKY